MNPRASMTASRLRPASFCPEPYIPTDVEEEEHAVQTHPSRRNSPAGSSMVLRVAQPQSRPDSSLVARNVRVDGRRTSVRLEAEMWAALRHVASRELKAVDDLVTI